MNKELLYLSLLQLLLSVIFGLAILFITYSMMKGRLLRGGIKPNLSITIFTACYMFSVAYIMTGTIQPIADTIRILSKSYSNFDLILNCSKYMVLFLFTGTMISLLLTYITIKLYDRLTKENEEEELRKDNIHVAIISGIIIIVMAIFVKDSFSLLIESFIPVSNKISPFN